MPKPRILRPGNSGAITKRRLSESTIHDGFQAGERAEASSKNTTSRLCVLLGSLLIFSSLAFCGMSCRQLHSHKRRERPMAKNVSPDKNVVKHVVLSPQALSTSQTHIILASTPVTSNRILLNVDKNPNVGSEWYKIKYLLL